MQAQSSRDHVWLIGVFCRCDMKANDVEIQVRKPQNFAAVISIKGFAAQALRRLSLLHSPLIGCCLRISTKCSDVPHSSSASRLCVKNVGRVRSRRSKPGAVIKRAEDKG